MAELDGLATQFEAHRRHLRAVALRMLGSASEAEDAVQEAWLKLSRADAGAVHNLGGWLTTVVARVCLDMLRSRRSRREEPLAAQPRAALEVSSDASEQLALADAVGPALLVVLETMAPAERVAFVLHDLFAVEFEEIARILGRSEAATRQLASRGRRRVQGAPAVPDADRARQRKVVEAFLAAARGGDFAGLLAVLDPEVVMRTDAEGVRMGAAAEVRGADGVAGFFNGRAQAARPALLDGEPAAVWAPGGKPRVVFDIAFDGERIVAIDLVADPARIAALEVVVLGG
jgi:RNA polymerase sigma-70 factor (ECF subfamily)